MRTKKMSRATAIATLMALVEESKDDRENAHMKADQVLLDYIGDDEISEIFDDVHKWYA